MIKCKKLLTAIFVLALIPLFTLPVYASDNDALKTLQRICNRQLQYQNRLQTP